MFLLALVAMPPGVVPQILAVVLLGQVLEERSQVALLGDGATERVPGEVVGEVAVELAQRESVEAVRVAGLGEPAAE